MSAILCWAKIYFDSRYLFTFSELPYALKCDKLCNSNLVTDFQFYFNFRPFFCDGLKSHNYNYNNKAFHYKND